MPGVYPVIMCGGSGTRLWPASRPGRPKQFIPLVGERSLFQETVLRLAGLADARPPLVVAGLAHGSYVLDQLAELGTRGVLLMEPEARDSAPAMAAAAAWIAREDPEGVAVVVASDHHVPDAGDFRAAVDRVVGAAREGYIVTLGIRPLSPSSAYGYIKPGEALDSALGGAARVEAFVEKPDEATAKGYLAAGYLWNSGNFVTSAATLMGELCALAPEVAAPAREAVETATPTGGGLRLGEAFRRATRISIDYAVMEKTARAAVLAVDFAWSDLGAWDAVWAAAERDGDGNAIQGDALATGSQGLLIRNRGPAVVAAVGVRDLAIVVEDDAVLVCALDRAQGVKAVVDRLKAAGRPEVDLPRPAPNATLAAPTLADWAARLERWAWTAALPLWWSLGADHARGGFHESLDAQARASGAARRARVQTRQAYVYATAGAQGWPGPWREAAEHGLDFFLHHYRRPDGRYRTLVGVDGAALDETATLYDQAFALLAFASVFAVAPDRADLPAEAEALLARLRESLALPAGGFRESGAEPFESNPHMHLFEAALAWVEAGGGPAWTALAGDIARLCLERFIDAEGGYLREHFDDAWRPAAGEAGRLVEPGHQFEWAWLLERWARLSGDARASAAARRLFEVGLVGVDGARGVAVDALDADLSVRSPRARLWPQTELLKAALLLAETADGEARAGYLEQARGAAAGLWRYLETDVPGLWRDKLNPDGSWVDEPAPASSFYHIMAAVVQLRRSAAVIGGA